MHNSNSHMMRTDPDWFYYLKNNNLSQDVNFWRKDTNKINNIQKNDRIYFLRKKTKQYPQICIIGMAEFKDYIVLSLKDAWAKYNYKNGCSDFSTLSKNFHSNIDTKIGCLILTNLIFLNKPIPLSETCIEFSRKIQSRKSLTLYEENTLLDLIDVSSISDPLANTSNSMTGKEQLRLTKTRINQSYFRQQLIKKYKKCVLCGLSNQNLLIASHSKPWSESNTQEKVDPMNGLLLCPNHDSLFDKHLISFDENKKILISPSIKESDFKLLNISYNLSINIPDEAMSYIDYHRQKYKEKIKNPRY